jgi:hypothetical protein
MLWHSSHSLGKGYWLFAWSLFQFCQIMAPILEGRLFLHMKRRILHRFWIACMVSLFLLIVATPNYAQSDTITVTQDAPASGTVTTQELCSVVSRDLCYLLSSVQVIKICDYGANTGNPIVPNGGGLYEVLFTLRPDVIFQSNAPCYRDKIRFRDCPSLYTNPQFGGSRVDRCDVESGPGSPPGYYQDEAYIIDPHTAYYLVYIPIEYKFISVPTEIFATATASSLCHPTYGCRLTTRMYVNFNSNDEAYHVYPALSLGCQ